MMRKRLTMVALLALAFLFLPVRAYADFSLDPFGNGNIWTGRVNDTDFGAFTRANDIYDAAVYAIGQDPITLSSEVRSKLSDPDHGGHFYEFARSFVNLEGSYDLPEWLPIYMLVMVPNFPDWPRYWKVEVSYSLRTNAETDFKRVLAGEDLGGGGSGGGSSDNPYDLSSFGCVTLNAFDCTFSDSSMINNNLVDGYNCSIVGNVLVPSSGVTKCSGFTPSSNYVAHCRIYYSADVAAFVNSKISDGYDVVFTTSTVWVGHGLSISRGSFGDGTCLKVFSSDGILTSYSFVRASNFFYDGSLINFAYTINSSGSSVALPAFIQYFGSVISSPIPVPTSPPSGTWPEPEIPVTPTAPEQPTPTAPTVTPDPTITEPTPTWPDVTININPDPTVSVTPTGLDYTELLTRINDNLNTINSYSVSINSNLNSLRSDLVTEFESVEQGLKNIYQYLQHFDSLLERHCKHLRDALDDGIYNLELYLKQLFEWLPQQLNFDANFDYDDSSIQTLLRRILTKIPGTSSGLPNDTMPNPVADEPGFFDWLSDLWHRFLIDLVSVLPDELGGLVDAFSQLTHYFPFSIPWDLAALLALFEHEPVTPVFDVPWGFGGGDGEVEMVHVDLSPWDGVMQMVRPVFVVGFCWQLALITKDLLSGFDINKGGV